MNSTKSCSSTLYEHLKNCKYIKDLVEAEFREKKIIEAQCFDSNDQEFSIFIQIDDEDGSFLLYSYLKNFTQEFQENQIESIIQNINVVNCKLGYLYIEIEIVQLNINFKLKSWGISSCEDIVTLFESFLQIHRRQILGFSKDLFELQSKMIIARYSERENFFIIS